MILKSQSNQQCLNLSQMDDSPTKNELRIDYDTL